MAARVNATSKLLDIEVGDAAEPAASGQNDGESAASGQSKKKRSDMAEPAASGQNDGKSAASGRNKRKRSDMAAPAASGQNDGKSAASGQSSSKRRRSLTRQSTVDITEAEILIARSRMEPIAASLFHDNTLLPTLAAQHSANFKTLLPEEDHGRSSVGELTWGSLCSGSEGAHFVMEAINEHFGKEPAINEHLFGRNFNALHLRQVFACEIMLSKRKWIDALVNGPRRDRGEPLMCIFCDIRFMGRTLSECHVHGRLCIVPGCDILVCSTSCKDLSKLSSCRSSEPVLGRAESPGGSAETFRGLLSYLDAHTDVGFLVYENSDNMDDAQTEKSLPVPDAASGQVALSNSEIFTTEITSRGMEGQSFVLNSALFGVPASRKRFWSLFVNCVGSRTCDFTRRSVTDVFRTLRLLVQVCQRLPPSAVSLLLKDSDPAVCTELERRTIGMTKRDPTPFSWMNEHQKFMDLLLLPAHAPPPCDATSQSPWFKTLTRKQQSTLVIHQATMVCSCLPKKTVGGLINPTQEQRNAHKKMTILDSLRKGVGGALGSAASGQTVKASDLKFMIDVMPSPGRVSASTKDVRNEDVILAPCIVPNNLLWIHRDDGNSQRLLTGQEAMLFQGWPIGHVNCDGSEGVTSTFLQDLAGNAASPPVLLAVLLALFYSVSWKSPTSDSDRPEASDADANEALTMLRNFQRSSGEALLRSQAGDALLQEFRRSSVEDATSNCRTPSSSDWNTST